MQAKEREIALKGTGNIRPGEKIPRCRKVGRLAAFPIGCRRP